MSYFTQKFCCCFEIYPLYSERQNIQISSSMATGARLVFLGHPGEMDNPRCFAVFPNHFIWYCYTLTQTAVRSYKIILHSPLSSESISLVSQPAVQFNQGNLLSTQFVQGTGPRMSKRKPSASSQHTQGSWLGREVRAEATRLNLWRRREARGRLCGEKSVERLLKN